MSGNASAFENIMRGITGDDSYKFGDMTKKAATTASTTVATTIKDLTGKDATDCEPAKLEPRADANTLNLDGHCCLTERIQSTLTAADQFGDITKKAVASLAGKETFDDCETLALEIRVV